MPKSSKSPPKRLDPALWIEARREWEGTPDMTYSAVAARLGVSVPTVTLRAQRELWVRGNIIDLERIDVTPMQMVEVSIRALMRAAQQTKDIPSAIKAAGMLLDRALGRVVQEAKPLMLSPEGQPPSSVPDESWLTARRLMYQEAIAAGVPPSPEPAEPELIPEEPKAQIAAPARIPDPACPIPEPARPSLRAVPRFYDSPTRPAVQ